MEIVSNKDEMIFRKDYDGKPSYSIGLSKRNKDGKFENGYIKAYFKSNTDLENKSKIKIKEAWLSFNVNEGKTYPYIFVNDYELVGVQNPYKEEKIEEENPYKEFGEKVEFDSGEQIQIDPSELPF